MDRGLIGGIPTALLWGASVTAPVLVPKIRSPIHTHQASFANCFAGSPFQRVQSSNAVRQPLPALPSPDRFTGWRVSARLCRLPIGPDTCPCSTLGYTGTEGGRWWAAQSAGREDPRLFSRLEVHHKGLDYEPLPNPVRLPASKSDPYAPEMIRSSLTRVFATPLASSNPCPLTL